MAQEQIDRRVNIIAWLDDFVAKEITDPDLLKHWENEGFNASMTDETMYEMASDEDTFTDIVDTFSSIIGTK